MICMVKIRFLQYDNEYSLRGETLKQAFDEDIKNGLIPFYVWVLKSTFKYLEKKIRLYYLINKLFNLNKTKRSLVHLAQLVVVHLIV